MRFSSNGKINKIGRERKALREKNERIIRKNVRKYFGVDTCTEIEK